MATSSQLSSQTLVERIGSKELSGIDFSKFDSAALGDHLADVLSDADKAQSELKKASEGRFSALRNIFTHDKDKALVSMFEANQKVNRTVTGLTYLAAELASQTLKNQEAHIENDRRIQHTQQDIAVQARAVAADMAATRMSVKGLNEDMTAFIDDTERLKKDIRTDCERFRQISELLASQVSRVETFIPRVDAAFAQHVSDREKLEKRLQLVIRVINDRIRLNHQTLSEAAEQETKRNLQHETAIAKQFRSAVIAVGIALAALSIVDALFWLNR